jgi:molecular chaperone HscC
MWVGIDLGTTNSAVAVFAEGAARILPNALGHRLTPSAVSLGDDGALLVGLAARERQVTHPQLTATAFKRYMGSTRTTRLGKRDFLPEELSALVLRQLKADAEAALGETVTGAVITVPAYFNDRQRKATRRAGELAGLNVERLVNEPTAAALAHGIHQRDANTQFLVFDLGGGTFDVSVLELFEGVIEVRSSTGDNFLGGEDFNELLIDWLFKEHQALLGVARKDTDPALYQVLRAAAERGRRALTTADPVDFTLTWQGQAHASALSREAFDKLAEPLMTRLREPVLRALRDAGVKAAGLDQVVLIGGATRMPVVRQAVAKMFGRFPALGPDPDEAVALGAAIQAGLKARDAALREVVLTDVCPYSLGVDVGERLPDGTIRSGLFEPIIERNTVVPASRVKSFGTMNDRQRQVEFGIFQGESRHVAQNIRLGTITIPVPQAKAGEVQLDCRFTYDINGLLEVDVEVAGTGERRALTIVGDGEAPDPVTLEQRRAALAALKVHPREDATNAALLARAARCYEEQLGTRREQVGRWILVFEQALERQDPREITRLREELQQALDALEGETFL